MGTRHNHQILLVLNFFSADVKPPIPVTMSPLVAMPTSEDVKPSTLSLSHSSLQTMLHYPQAPSQPQSHPSALAPSLAQYTTSSGLSQSEPLPSFSTTASSLHVPGLATYPTTYAPSSRDLLSSASAGLAYPHPPAPSPPKAIPVMVDDHYSAHASAHGVHVTHPSPIIQNAHQMADTRSSDQGTQSPVPIKAESVVSISPARVPTN